jgi:hypothetical protein
MDIRRQSYSRIGYSSPIKREVESPGEPNGVCSAVGTLPSYTSFLVAKLGVCA